MGLPADCQPDLTGWHLAPRAIQRICFLEMHLGVDNRAFACGLRLRLLFACDQRCAGGQRFAEWRRVIMMATT